MINVFCVGQKTKIMSKIDKAFIITVAVLLAIGAFLGYAFKPDTVFIIERQTIPGYDCHRCGHKVYDTIYEEKTVIYKNGKEITP